MFLCLVTNIALSILSLNFLFLLVEINRITQYNAYNICIVVKNQLILVVSDDIIV